MTTIDHETELHRLARAEPWLMDVLATVRKVDLPNWSVAGGVVRTLVWDHLHGHETRTPSGDVDVVFFDPSDVSRERDHELERSLTSERPDVPWQVTNQAGVHLWYRAKFGSEIDPATSLENGLSQWSEAATAVGLRLLSDDSLATVAPFGLDELFGMVFRKLPTVSEELFDQRVAGKRIEERWPKVQIVRE